MITTALLKDETVCLCHWLILVVTRNMLYFYVFILQLSLIYLFYVVDNHLMNYALNLSSYFNFPKHNT